eukprot:scaffold102_cov340-Pavlova_lutheri.AAC.86
MPATQAASSCFYRLRGKVIIRIGGSELATALECVSKRQEECIQCGVCGRRFHSSCDEHIRDERTPYGMTTEDGTSKDPTPACPSPPTVVGDTASQVVAPAIVCFPCQHGDRVE